MTAATASSRAATTQHQAALTRETAARLAGSAAVWGGFVAGIALLAYSYSIAAGRPDADQLHFHIFWLGELAFLVPALLRLLDRHAATRDRLAILVATALFDAVPKYLRDPSSPVYHDELIHSRQADAVLAAGEPFQATPVIGIVQFFPGLHTLAASLAAVTGARLFVVEIALLVVLRVLALIGMFVLAERVTGSAYLGALASFVYAANPSFLFFDAQFAYETLAIVLVVWTLAAVAALQSDVPKSRFGWSLVALGAGVVCVVTHHVGSYGLTAVLVVAAVASVAAAIRGRASWQAATATATATTAIAILVAAAAVGWLVFIATGVIGYLAPHVAGGVHQVFHLINHEQESRVLFAKSFNPWYERAAAFAAPVIAFIAALAVLVRGRRLRPRVPAGYAVVVLGLLYFPSLPFIYTQAGNEGARRSWAYSYVGLSILLALAAAAAVSRARGRGLQLASRVTCAVAFAALLVGNVGGDLNAWYRFPGRPTAQSDARISTPELRNAAAWFRGSEGPGRRVLTDVLSAPTFAFFGNAFPPTPSRGFPTWQLFLSAGLPSARLRSELASSHFDYAVVNRLVPRLRSSYLTRDLAGAKPSAQAAPGAFAKFDRAPWSSRLYSSDRVAIYRLDVRALARINPKRRGDSR